MLERDPAKWKPVRRQITRQNKELERRSYSIGTDHALVARGGQATEKRPLGGQAALNRRDGGPAVIFVVGELAWATFGLGQV